ncbi:hypothetical protein BJY01DRAFT_221067 [Aspergillus pseudoustus]|uniref:Ankyrin repeat-containing domain protein n=1 Tax=Aspergillus pseudoustus TaxID=1810923 RepID=A0ABR4JEE1_9EURO
MCQTLLWMGLPADKQQSDDHLARDYAEIMEALLRRGATPDVANNAGQTPLHLHATA